MRTQPATSARHRRGHPQPERRCPRGATTDDLLVGGAGKTGTARFRYNLNDNAGTSSARVTISFDPSAFKAPTARATTPSRSTFGVDGATARLTDPGAGGTIDVNVLNNRNWVDVAFRRRRPTAALDGSVTDLDARVHARRRRASARSRSTARARR